MRGHRGMIGVRWQSTLGTLFGTAASTAGNGVSGGMSKLAKRVATGTTLLFSGVAFLTLNERRDVAMAKLRHSAQLVAVSAEERPKDGKKKVDGVTMNGRLLHYVGTLFAPTEPRDHMLEVGNSKLVALRRKVEMYQWREQEHKVTTTDKDGKTSTKITYSYDKVWSTNAEESTHDPDRRNPSFPTGLPPGVQVFASRPLLIGKDDRLVLNDGLTDFVLQKGTWQPLTLGKEFFDPAKKLDYGLKPNRGQAYFTNSEALFSDRIGDIRVSYEGIFSAPHTSVAKLVKEDGKLYLEPFKASLKESLGSQGKIEVPRDINEILGIELDSYIIPEKIVAQMESILLQLAPLHINYIDSGHKSLPAAFQSMETRDAETLWYLRVAGTAMIGVGILSLTPLSLGPGLMVSGAGAAWIAFKTIQTARPKYRRGGDAPDMVI